ncbi:hypothetical protein NEOKW01_1072 [Nematocida sp. AWRm80]|nr:hypothetical protein NEOKW01_1072 [Nematocida sp. AWRm80]
MIFRTSLIMAVVLLFGISCQVDIEKYLVPVGDDMHELAGDKMDQIISLLRNRSALESTEGFKDIFSSKERSLSGMEMYIPDKDSLMCQEIIEIDDDDYSEEGIINCLELDENGNTKKQPTQTLEEREQSMARREKRRQKKIERTIKRAKQQKNSKPLYYPIWSKLDKEGRDIPLNMVFKKNFIVVTIYNITKSLLKTIKLLRREKLSIEVFTYIKRADSILYPNNWQMSRSNTIRYYDKVESSSVKRKLNPLYPFTVVKKKIESPNKRYQISQKAKIIMLRGLAMLSNAILVDTEKEKLYLQGVFGIPEEKIIAHVSDGIRNSAPTVIRSQKSYPTLSDGMYVYYSSPNIHINVQIVDNAIEKVYVRTVKEIPHRTGIYYERGPYKRHMHESFAIIEKNYVRINVELPNIFDATVKVLIVKIPGATVRINKKTLKITIIGPAIYLKGKGISTSSKHLSKWRLASTLNMFSLDNKNLKYKINGHPTGMLYNRPRRFANELFDPIMKKNPLKRFYIYGYFGESGYGFVSIKFLLDSASDQRFLVRSTEYNPKVLQNTEWIDYKLLHIYLLESNQTIPSKVLNLPGEFKDRGITLRNKFPPLTFPRIPGYRLFIHFPWEFTKVPSKWVDPIVKRKTNVLVPSKFNQEVHVDQGIPASKVKIFPHGVSFYMQQIMQKMEKRCKSLRVTKLFRSPSSYTRFVAINGAIERKGIEYAMQAFIKAFTNKDKVVLRVHVAYGDDYMFDRLERIVYENTRQKGPLIVYSRGYYSQKYIRGLLTNAHFNVSPYRGEGFGLSILEGMGFGTVPIVTNCKPATEFCDTSSAMFIPYKKEKCLTTPVGTIGPNLCIFGYKINDCPIWATPDVDALAKILQNAHRMVSSQPNKYKKMQQNCINRAKNQTWVAEIRKLTDYMAMQ